MGNEASKKEAPKKATRPEKPPDPGEVAKKALELSHQRAKLEREIRQHRERLEIDATLIEAVRQHNDIVQAGMDYVRDAEAMIRGNLDIYKDALDSTRSWYEQTGGDKGAVAEEEEEEEEKGDEATVMEKKNGGGKEEDGEALKNKAQMKRKGRGKRGKK